MEIKVAVCVQKQDQCVPVSDWVAVASPEALINAAFSVSIVFDALRAGTRQQMPSEGKRMAEAALDFFDQFTTQERERDIERFRQYTHLPERMPGEEEALPKELVVKKIREKDGRQGTAYMELKKFKPEVLAFFGRLMLSGRIIIPEEAELLQNLVCLMMVILKNSAENKGSDPLVTQHFMRAFQCLDPVIDHCAHAAKHKVGVIFAIDEQVAPAGASA